MAFMFQEKGRQERYEFFSLFTYFLPASIVTYSNRKMEGAITCFTSKWLIFLLCNNIIENCSFFRAIEELKVELSKAIQVVRDSPPGQL